MNNLKYKDQYGHIIGEFHSINSLSNEDIKLLIKEQKGRETRENNSTIIDKNIKTMMKESKNIGTKEFLNSSGFTQKETMEILETLKEDPEFYRDPLETIYPKNKQQEIKTKDDSREYYGDDLEFDTEEDTSEEIWDGIESWDIDQENGWNRHSSIIRFEKIQDIIPDQNIFDRLTPRGRELKRMGLPIPSKENWNQSRWEEKTRRIIKERTYHDIHNLIFTDNGKDYYTPNKDPKKGGRPRKNRAA